MFLFRIPRGRLLMWLVIVVAFYAGAKYAQMYFYVAAFDDFVRDEVRFAPARKTTDKDHLTAHLMDAAGEYGVQLDPHNIQITSRQQQPNIQTLTVDVSYSAELDLRFYRPEIQFHSQASIYY